MVVDDIRISHAIKIAGADDVPRSGPVEHRLNLKREPSVPAYYDPAAALLKMNTPEAVRIKVASDQAIGHSVVKLQVFTDRLNSGGFQQLPRVGGALLQGDRWSKPVRGRRVADDDATVRRGPRPVSYGVLPEQYMS